MFRFAHPYLLWLLALLPLAAWYVLRRRPERSVAYSSLDLLLGAGLEASPWKRHATLALRLLVLALVIVGLAGPQTGRSKHTTLTWWPAAFAARTRPSTIRSRPPQSRERVT